MRIHNVFFNLLVDVEIRFLARFGVFPIRFALHGINLVPIATKDYNLVVLSGELSVSRKHLWKLRA